MFFLSPSQSGFIFLVIFWLHKKEGNYLLLLYSLITHPRAKVSLTLYNQRTRTWPELEHWKLFRCRVFCPGKSSAKTLSQKWPSSKALQLKLASSVLQHTYSPKLLKTFPEPWIAEADLGFSPISLCDCLLK